jgi:hypothetical protein
LRRSITRLRDVKVWPLGGASPSFLRRRNTRAPLRSVEG